MLYTINQLREKAFSDVFQVYQVFIDYFGASSVDLQNIPSDDEIAEVLEERNIQMREDGSGYDFNGRQVTGVVNSLAVWKPFILVYWPRVKVTNENEASIIIHDLYAKIDLDAKGRIPTENRGFLLNRATYPMEQWVSNYMHSHICSIPKDNLDQFQQPCLGSGPIIQTINNLKADLSEGFDEIRWMLFCEELSRYVTVESLKGIPYNKLEEVCMSRRLDGYGEFKTDTYETERIISYFNSTLGTDKLASFIEYYLKHGHLAINYQNGSFVIGMSYFDYIIDISNAFIDFFNSKYQEKELVPRLFSNKILNNTVTAGNKFFEVNGQRALPDVSRYEGKKVCMFKGNEVRLHITTSGADYNPQKTTVFSHWLAMYILNNILKIINYHYTNEYSRKQGGISSSSSTAVATTRQTVYYL